MEEASVERLPRLLRTLGRIPGGLEDVARRVVGALAGDARAETVDRAVEGFLAEPVPLRELVGDVADDECPRHVGAAGRLVVPRPEVDHDRLAGGDLPFTHVVPDRRLRPV